MFFKDILTLLWSISDDNKLVIWCLFYGIRNMLHSTEYTNYGISLVDVVVWMKFVLRNGKYSIAEESNNNSVG